MTSIDYKLLLLIGSIILRKKGFALLYVMNLKKCPIAKANYREESIKSCVCRGLGTGNWH